VAAALGQVHHGDQRRAYFANTTGRRLAHATEKVIDDLAQAVQHPVRWLDAVRLMPELGVTAAIQTPPGHVLAAITARETPGVTSIAVDDVGLDTALRRTAGRDRNVTRLSTPAGTGSAATPGQPAGWRSANVVPAHTEGPERRHDRHIVVDASSAGDAGVGEQGPTMSAQ
jgi:hypothetical protein